MELIISVKMASAKQYTELCPAHFRDEMCLGGKTCTFAHEAPPPNAKNWKMSYCPKFFNGTCERNDLCNFIHHPNHELNLNSKS